MENDKSTGKRQGKHREFSLNQSVATLILSLCNKNVDWPISLASFLFSSNEQNSLRFPQMVANIDGERMETVTTELKMNLVCAGGSTRLLQTVQVLFI